MLGLSGEEIERRACRLRAALNPQPGVRTLLVDGASTIGGGSAPGSALPTRLLAVEVDGLSADTLEARLRALSTPVIARIEDGRVVLDLRTVVSDQDDDLAAMMKEAVSRGPGE